MAPPPITKQSTDERLKLAEDINAKLKADARLKSLELENSKLAQLAESPKEEPMFKGARGLPCPERFRGTKTYVLKADHYRQGQYLSAGERITVTDEAPSRTWELVTKSTLAPVEVVEAPSSRDADTAI